jgi:hypothetical protein
MQSLETRQTTDLRWRRTLGILLSDQAERLSGTGPTQQIFCDANLRNRNDLFSKGLATARSLSTPVGGLEGEVPSMNTRSPPTGPLSLLAGSAAGPVID